MNNEDYASYELALKLKECGFDEPCDHYYCAFDNETDVRFWSIHPAQSQNGFVNPKNKVIADAPTLAHAQKWLREAKGIDVEIRVCIVDGKKGYEAYVIPPYALTPAQRDYESALSAGIVTALELIKKGE